MLLTEREALLGRERECRRLDELVERARAGESGALVIRGEPGIGKTALLEYARGRAHEMAVVAARGGERESQLAFALLDQLLRPLLGRVTAIPAPQASALGSALAFGPPAPGDRFAVGAATLSLLAAAAEDQPLLALVDDAHWGDRSSVEALLFATRRLRAESIAVVMTVREDGLPDAGLEELMLDGLGVGAACELVGRRRNLAVPTAVGGRLQRQTRGNPLALVQLTSFLSDDELSGRKELPDPLPAIELERAFVEHVARLPLDAQRLLQIAAATESGALGEIVPAAESLRLDPDFFTAAEQAGLVTVERDHVRFQHPLLRSAVYHATAPDERRAVHRALARALELGDEPERSAWHLAHAALGPDDEVAQKLETAGEQARQRGDHAAAAAAFARAARLTRQAPRRAGRLLSAAEASFLAGRLEDAANQVDEAIADVGDPALHGAAVHLRAVVDLWRGRPRAARERLTTEAERISEIAPASAVSMLFGATIASVMTFEPERALDIAERAFAIAEDADEDVHELAAAVFATSLLTRGRAREARDLLERARRVVELPPAAPDPYQAARHFVWHFYIFLEWYAEAGRLFDSAIERARAASAPGLLPFPLAFRAELRFRTGAWHDAYADAAESALLAEQTGQSTQLPHSLATLARVEAGQGRVDDCRRHCERALALAREHGSEAIGLYTGAALGLLELGLGEPDRAIRELEPVWSLSEARGAEEPEAVPVSGDLIEAHIRAGRVQDAEDLLAVFEPRARALERAWPSAVAARCRGLLADERSFDACFAEALRSHGRAAMPFERARTELCHGERLRRARRLVEARTPLRSALAVFERLGAQPWAEKARTELRASGEAPRTSGTPSLAELTAQELQVARLVAEGATNREAAAALFLSPKTIDFHLRNIYRKLEIRSRSELTRVAARLAGLLTLAPSVWAYVA